MAVSVQSKTDPVFSTAKTVTVTKPTGLTVGDLMIAQMVCQFSATVTTPSGWTILSDTQANNYKQVIMYKIASSSDVSASDFTFDITHGGGALNIACGILRISDFPSAMPVYAYDTETANTGTGTVTYSTIGMTPLGDSLIIMGIVGSDSGVTNISSYSIATSSPTFTEAWDVVIATGVPASIALAYGVRPQNTSTGDATITGFGTGGQRSCCALVSVPQSKDVTPTETLNTADNNIMDYGLNIYDTVLSTDDKVLLKNKPWTNSVKSNSTWTNQEK